MTENAGELLLQVEDLHLFSTRTWLFTTARHALGP
jgi:hypothetical protein